MGEDTKSMDMMSLGKLLCFIVVSVITDKITISDDIASLWFRSLKAQ